MTRVEMRKMQERLNDTIIGKNDLIDRLSEKMTIMLKEIEKLQKDNRILRRKLYEGKR